MEQQKTINGEIDNVLNGFNKKTRIVIEIDTKIKNFKLDGDSMKKEVEDNFHNACFKVIEDYLTDGGDEYCDAVLMEMEQDYLPKKVKEFGDLGEISIRISQEEVK